MYIESLYIEDFGGTKDRHISFDRGINIIEGKNESGKSTLAAFIRFVFYGFADKAQRQRYYSWGSDRAMGSMVIVCRDKRYRIERQYIENSGDRIQIIDLQTNLPAFHTKTPEEAFFGVSGDIFSHTAHIGQASGGYINGSKISASIENILFSADEHLDTGKALERLDDARVILQHKRGKGGRIYELSRERDELIKRMDAAKASSSGIIEKEGSLREAMASIEQNEKRLQANKELLEYYESAKQYRTYKKYKTLKKKASELEALTTALRSSYTYNGFLPDGEYIERLKTLDREISNLEETAAELHRETEQQRKRNSDLFEMSLFIDKVNEKGGIDDVISSYKHIKGAKTVYTVTAVFAFIIAAALGIATALLFRNSTDFIVYGALSAAIFLILGLIFVVCSSRQRINLDEFLTELDVDSQRDFDEAVNRFVTDENKLSIHNSRILELDDKYEKVLKLKQEKEEQAMAEALRWGRSSYTEALQKATEVVKLINDNSNEAEKYALASEAFKDQIDNIDPAALKQKLNGRPYTEDAFDMTAVNEALREDDFYRKATQCLIQKKNTLEKELAVLYATAEDPMELSDRVNLLSGSLDSLSKKLKGYLLAHQKLAEASENLRLGVSPKLADYASNMLDRLTDGRYQRLGVSKDISLRYETDMHNRDVEYMSQGTRDLAYYSLRIALIHLLYKNELPPVVFDESFAMLDERRLNNMLSVISEEKLQSLIFTAQPREAQCMKEKGLSFKHMIL